MAQFSLWKNGRSKDYKFIDRIISQNMKIGGTAVYVHKYSGIYQQSGSGDATNTVLPNSTELTIQDVLLLENRDRKYDKDIIDLRGVYNVEDTEFNLSQFGILFQGQTLFISFHINDMLAQLGRKLMAGDVLELPHRRDDMLLDPTLPAINAFFVVKDANRSADGYSPTWLPHIWRVRCEPITDSPEYRDIFNQEYGNGKLGDVLSNMNNFLKINDIINNQAQTEVPERGYDNAHYYVGQPGINNGDNTIPSPFNGDGIPPNENALAPYGTRFPQNPNNGDYFLRIDYVPARLFKRDGDCWKLVEIVYRDQYHVAHRVLSEHLDDTKITTVGLLPDDTFNERQALDSVVLPKQDFPHISDINGTN